MGVPLKQTEFVPYTVDFADGYGRKGSFLRLHDKCLLVKQDHINLGFVLDTPLKFQLPKTLNVCDVKKQC